MLDFVEHNMSLIHQVEQTSRRCDNDIDAAAQVFGLGVLGHATKDNGLAQGQLATITVKFIRNLNGEFTGRRQNKRTWVTIFAAGLNLVEFMQDRQRESCCLACAGLGNSEKVVTVEDVGNGLRLNRRRCHVLAGCQCTEDRLGKAEIRKSTFCHLEFSLYAGRPII